MAISVYTKNEKDPDKQYDELSLQWSDGVSLKSPCCLVVDMTTYLYLLGIFTAHGSVKKSLGKDVQGNFAGYDDNFKLDKQITVARVRKQETEAFGKKYAPTEWDLFLAEKLAPYDGKIVSVKINLGDLYKAMWDEAKADAQEGDDSWFKQYFSVEESKTSDEFKAQLEETKDKLPKNNGGSYSGKGGYKYVSESEKLKQRLEFLSENSEKLSEVVAAFVGELAVAQKFEDNTCLTLSDSDKSKIFDITPEYVQSLTRDIVTGLLGG